VEALSLEGYDKNILLQTADRRQTPHVHAATRNKLSVLSKAAEGLTSSGAKMYIRLFSFSSLSHVSSILSPSGGATKASSLL